MCRWASSIYAHGWIQGRALEALTTHAAFFDTRDPALAERLHQVGQVLYEALRSLVSADGHAYFCYGPKGDPVRRDGAGGAVEQDRHPDIYTYSGAFAAKGLLSAAGRYEPEAIGEHAACLGRVVSAIEDGRFQLDEHCAIGEEALAAQPDDYGPRMILLGATGLLRRLSLAAEATYGDRFIAHVLDHHLDSGSGLLSTVVGGDRCDVGHGIEFAGFAADHLAGRGEDEMLRCLEAVLRSSFHHGFKGPGVVLTVSVTDGQPTSPYCPWWTLPETIRSAALLNRELSGIETLRMWRSAHEAFFTHYWLGHPPIAYQCRTSEGPVDYVPATPDLDPGYHTGLSLLKAIEMAEDLLEHEGSCA